MAAILAHSELFGTFKVSLQFDLAHDTRLIKEAIAFQKHAGFKSKEFILSVNYLSLKIVYPRPEEKKEASLASWLLKRIKKALNTYVFL